MGGLPRTPRHLDFITDPTSLEVQRQICLQGTGQQRRSHPLACYMPDVWFPMLKELTPWQRTAIQVSALIKGGLRSNCEGKQHVVRKE